MKTLVDPNSATWSCVEAHALRVIAASTEALLQPHVSERVADLERGKIEALRKLLALAPALPVPGKTPAKPKGPVLYG